MSTARIPTIDLGGKVQIIDDSSSTPQWKTLARIIATKENAKRIARQHALSAVWLVDDLGYREYITL